MLSLWIASFTERQKAQCALILECFHHSQEEIVLISLYLSNPPSRIPTVLAKSLSISKDLPTLDIS